MSRVLRRLEKLEATLTERSHLTPHSQEWFDYWRERLDRCFKDGDDQAIAGMPIEFYRVMVGLAVKVKEEEAERARHAHVYENGLTSNRQA
jgi:hypothetical protein